MFARIAPTVLAHPWRVIAVWGVAAIPAIAFTPSLDDYTTGDQQSFLPASFESVQAQDAGDTHLVGTAPLDPTVLTTLATIWPRCPG